ncbi:PAS domain S-box-containing protein/diguanylate cyclase (GGDEF) domain-containing protein [Vibrio gazogenes DSM 21264]|uniref:diguanylate cyclase n=1 Tax=Vibrio gazogenes DSM 21264 = NBRC 103151 TaxID=1123492 RepID=A0A1M4VA21_VIBGA|nr:PAS domain S-box-containing protein/diguanylate cyclase (GGDEF) domain-containing protein [Vibrio gazogenes DSM 21264] [Vibrio gazogenes DSM 21264 = NBRC 103151]SJN57132.1 Response regulator PleD [Vibrio gazogenes]
MILTRKFPKLFLFYSLLVGTFLFLLSMLYRVELYKVDTTMINNASNQIFSARKALENALRWRVSDMNFFKRTLSAAEFDQSGHLKTEKITSLWRTFIQSRRVYTEVKWVDFSGQEQIKISYKARGVSVTQEKELTNIRKVSYFNDIMGFPRKKIFISPLSIDMKESINAINDVPVLVLGEKIENMSKNKSLKGVLIISYKVDNLLSRIYNINENLWISNNMGQWFKIASDNSLEKKYKLKYQIKMPIDHLQVWKKISAETSGTFIDDHEIGAFDTLLNVEKSGKLSGTRFYVSDAERKSPHYPLKIIYYVEKKHLEVLKKSIHDHHIVMIGGFVIFFILFGYYIFSMYFKSQKTINKLLVANTIIDNYVIHATVDLDDHLESVSEAFCQASGCTAEELQGQSYYRLCHPDVSKHLPADIKDNILADQSWSGEIKKLSKTGEVYWVLAYIEPTYDANKRLIGYTTVEQNITDRKHLEVLSVTDRLTGMHNRLKLDETLEREISRANRHKHPLSMIMFDIDDFKVVNDTFGHQIGDEVLCKIAELLKHHVRKTDIPGRWGGEEFLVVCPETDHHGVRILAENIRQLFMNHDFDVVGRCTCSFGVVTQQDNENAEQMIERADMALYTAKGRGKNRVESGERRLIQMRQHKS